MLAHELTFAINTNIDSECKLVYTQGHVIGSLVVEPAGGESADRACDQQPDYTAAART